MSRYDQGLERQAANHQPMTPISYLQRAALIHPDHIAVIHGGQRHSYARLWADCRRLASALAARGIGRGDTVSVLLSNTPPMIQAHFGVPMAGARCCIRSTPARTPPPSPFRWTTRKPGC